MRLTTQRRLTAAILKCSPKRVRFQQESLSDVKEAITKADLRSLVKQGTIKRLPVRGQSRARIRKKAAQKRKGRQRGQGSRKGKKTARLNPKRTWINRVRLQRKILQELWTAKKISPETHKTLYSKIKGGFFRNKRHLKLYIQERGLEK